MVEHEGHGTFRAEIAAILGKNVTHIGHRTHAIVGRAVDNERCAADAVAFVANVFVGDSFELTRALENRVLNRVLRDIAAARLNKRETQTGIRVRIAPAHSSGYDDFTDELRPEIGALGVLATLAVLNIGPLGMTRHLLINLKGVVVRGHPTPALSTDSSA